MGAYVDPGRTFFAPDAAGAGICLPRLLVVRPPNADMARRAVDALVRCGACALVVFDCTGLGEVLRAHQCARLASQAEKTGTALLALSNGNIPALASFASLRLRASGLAPLWQEGSSGGGRLAGCVTSVEIVKSRMSAPGKIATISAFLPDVAGSWPVADLPSFARPTTQTAYPETAQRVAANA
jgi:RecA/RadA recombinase